MSCAPYTKFGPDPGESEGAIRGYEMCVPVITALEAYRKVHRGYPDSLDELVPEHLAAVPAGPDGEPLIYTRQEETFALSFSFSGPGNNVCLYEPDKGWQCSGVY